MGVWDTPPTEAEIKGASIWDAPPTPAELGQSDAPEAAPANVDTKSGAGLWTRFQSSLRANKQDELSFLREKLGGDNVLPKLSKDRSEIENFYVREKPGGQWKLFDPDTGSGEELLRGILESTGAGLVGGPIAAAVPLVTRAARAIGKGDVAGDIADAGGDLIEGGALNPAALVAAGPAGVALAGGPLGDATASVARQALSAALPGKESVDQADRAKAVGMNVASGLAGEALGALGGAAARGVRRLLSPTYRLASEVASEGGQEAITSGAKKSVGDYTDRSAEIESGIAEATGESFRFSPAQRSGSRAALMAERTGQQMPEVMDELSKQQGQRISQFEKFLGAITKHVAADPARLNNLDTGKQVAGAVKRAVTDADKRLSAQVAPLYKEAETLLEGQMLPTGPATSVIRDELDRLPANGGDVAAKLRNTLKALSEADDGAATATTYKKLRAEQSFWSGLRKNPGTVLDGIDDKNARRIAGNVSRAIDDALEMAAENGAGPGVAKLREANAVYKAGRQKNEELATETVKQILRLDRKAKPEDVASKLWTMSPDQIGGVVRILQGTDETALAQLRANSLKNMFESAGKGSASKVLGDELGGAGLSPQKLVAQLEKNGAKLDALFADQPEIGKRLRLAAGAAKRLAGATAIAGSDTAPKMWMAMAMRKMGSGNGAVMSAIESVANNVLASPERMARALADPKGADEFSKLVLAIARPNTTQAATPAMARDVIAASTQLMAIAASAEEEAEEPARPTTRQRVAFGGAK